MKIWTETENYQEIRVSMNAAKQILGRSFRGTSNDTKQIRQFLLNDQAPIWVLEGKVFIGDGYWLVEKPAVGASHTEEGLRMKAPFSTVNAKENHPDSFGGLDVEKPEPEPPKKKKKKGLFR